MLMRWLNMGCENQAIEVRYSPSGVQRLIWAVRDGYLVDCFGNQTPLQSCWGTVGTLGWYSLSSEEQHWLEQGPLACLLNSAKHLREFLKTVAGRDDATSRDLTDGIHAYIEMLNRFRSTAIEAELISARVLWHKPTASRATRNGFLELWIGEDHSEMGRWPIFEVNKGQMCIAFRRDDRCSIPIPPRVIHDLHQLPSVIFHAYDDQIGDQLPPARVGSDLMNFISKVLAMEDHALLHPALLSPIFG